MIKVSEDIKKAIYEYAKLNEQATFHERKIIKWMKDMKITEETASCIERDLDDAFIDYCQMTNNPDEFIEIIENLDKEDI